MTFDTVRSRNRPPAVRAADGGDDGLGVMTGHFSTFNDWYRVDSSWEGTFLERIAPGAYEGSIRSDLPEIRVLFDHGFDPQLGNKVLGPIRSLREDTKGAYFEVPLFDTSYNRDLLPGLRAGQYGSSMRFEVEDDTWVKKPARAEHNPDGLPERTITRSRVKEFGPVTFPANAQATAGVRSDTDTYYERLRHVDKGAYAGAVRARTGAVVRMLGDSPDTMQTSDRLMLTRAMGWINAIDSLIDEAQLVLNPYLGLPPDMDENETAEDIASETGSYTPTAGMMNGGMNRRPTIGQLRAEQDEETLRLLGVIR